VQSDPYRDDNGSPSERNLKPSLFSEALDDAQSLEPVYHQSAHDFVNDTPRSRRHCILTLQGSTARDKALYQATW
jgi:hypothetical protein